MRLKDVTDASTKNIGRQKLDLFYGIISILNVMYYTHIYYIYGSDKIGKLHIIFGIYSVLSRVNQHTKTPRKYKHNPTIR